MKKLYATILSLGLSGCASSKDMVEHKMEILGQPASLSVDGNRCYLKKRISEYERINEDGEKIYGDSLLITYKCGKPNDIEASATYFKDCSLGRIDHTETFFGKDYLKLITTTAEKKLEEKKSNNVNKNQLDLSDVLR